jgi:transposase-like protein
MESKIERLEFIAGRCGTASCPKMAGYRLTVPKKGGRGGKQVVRYICKDCLARWRRHMASTDLYELPAPSAEQ